VNILDMGLPPHHLEKLKNVIEAASKGIEEGQEVGPVAFITTPYRTEVVPGYFQNEEEKDEFAKSVRAISRLIGADMVLFVSEAWSLILSQEEGDRYLKSDIATPPSRHPKRREVLAIVVETKAKTWQVIIPIKREGQKVTLGEMTILPSEPQAPIQGRMTNFLDRSHL
jgi:hypothetical protein